MKILLISAGLLDKRTGGVPLYLEECISALLSRGHIVHYLDPTGRDIHPGNIRRESSQRSDGLILTTLYNLRVVPDFGRGTLDPLEQVVPEPEMKNELGRFLEDYLPDLVHLHELIGFPIEAVRVFQARSIPVLLTAHDYYGLCPTIKLLLADGSACNLSNEQLVCKGCCCEGVSSAERKIYGAASALSTLLPRKGGFNSWWPLLRRLVRSTVRSSRKQSDYIERRHRFNHSLQSLDGILAVSKTVANLYQAIGGCKNNVSVEHPTRHTIRTRPCERGDRTRNTPLRALVLNVQRRPKGLDLLRQELDWLLKSGEQGIRLQAWGCSSMVHPLIDNLGAYRDGDLDAICQNADVGVVPSIWREAYGFVGAEMLSRGLPVIASNCGAMKEYIAQGHDGLLFDPGQPGDLAARLSSLARNPDSLATLSAGAREGWRKFQTVEAHVARLEIIYQNAIERRKRGPL